MNGTKQCPSCGATNHDHARFCAHCGLPYPAKPRAYDPPLYLGRFTVHQVAAGLVLALLPILVLLVNLSSRNRLTGNLPDVHPGDTYEQVVSKIGKPDQCEDRGSRSACMWSEFPDKGEAEAGLSAYVYFVGGRAESGGISRANEYPRVWRDWF